MESKKINQLATELTPTLSDLTIIGDPTTGISKKITLSQMASLFTGTVEEYANVAAFPLVGVADTIYIALDTNVLYRWDTGLTSYVELSPNIINSLVFSDANGFDGNISLVGSVATLTITTALTTGSVPFIGASGALSQDNANLFFDDTNNRLGINTNAPTTALDVFGSGIIGRVNGTSTNNAFLGFASAGTNKWSIGNVQSDHRFRIYNEATTTELISVLSTGEFGVGIVNPTTKIHIDGGATALIANLDANVSVAKSISFRSDNSNRINLEVSGTELGSNAGMDFFLRTYTDLGALIETPFTIVRSTGVTTIKSLTLTNALSVANGGTGITSLTTGRIPFGNGTSAFGSSANLIWDNTNSRLGINSATPAYSLDLRNGYIYVKGLQNEAGYIFENTTNGHILHLNANNSHAQLYTTTNSSIIFGTNNTNRAIITNTGNFGINAFTIPNALGQGTLQIGTTTNFINLSDQTYIQNNWYYTSGGTSTYLKTGNAARFLINTSGEFIFTNTPSGTGGTSITTENERMRIGDFVEVKGTGQLNLNGTTSNRISCSGNSNLTLQTSGTGSSGSVYLQTNGSNVVEVASNGTTYVFNSLTVGSDINLTRSAVTPAITYLSGIRIVDNATGNGYSISSPAASTMRVTGNLNVTGTLTKGGGSFKISHPIPEKKDSHYLIHSFVESPKADLIYRGKINLKNGKAKVNIDEISTMTEGTFILLTRDVQCFTTNESGFDLVKGKVIGNILNIESNNSNSTDEISFMVVAERNDEWLLNSDMVDENGRLIVEIEKTQREIELENMDFSNTEITE
jgi:hypothetical protein